MFAATFESEPGAGAPGPRVLVVEDDDAMREMLASALRRDGYAVSEARDGHEAFDELREAVLYRHQRSTAPALVVSDVRLPPPLTGLEILDAIRLANLRTPVILITAFGDRPLHEAALRLGAELVIDKPFDLDDLRAAVRYYVRIAPRRPTASGGLPHAGAV